MLRRGFALNHRLDQPVVLHEIDRVRRSPSYLARLSPRIERYLPTICAEARARGMPAEICLLPIIESGVNPAAESGSGARGLWQLVPGTAKRYGLKITWMVDERRDPIASTDAALRYLSDLQRRFSDWTLALAAYNCGETRVAKVLGSATAGASFFDLRWPTETAVYVPRLLAFAAIFADPSAHGITLPDRLRRNVASASPDVAPRVAMIAQDFAPVRVLGAVSRGARGGTPRKRGVGSIATPYGGASMCAHGGKSAPQAAPSASPVARPRSSTMEQPRGVAGASRTRLFHGKPARAWPAQFVPGGTSDKWEQPIESKRYPNTHKRLGAISGRGPYPICRTSVRSPRRSGRGDFQTRFLSQRVQY